MNASRVSLRTARRTRLFQLMLITVGVSVLMVACDSADKYKIEDVAPVVETVPETRELRVEGTPEQMRLVHGFASSLETAQSECAAGDTLRALAMVDSLSLLAEATLDTLSDTHPLNDFMMIYVTDTYGILRVWYAHRGDQDALDALGQRYSALAARLQQQRDTTTTVP